MVRNISPREAEELVQTGRVRLLDVRTPSEYRDLGHIPGALLLPVDLVAVAPATLDRDGMPWLVYCEHGIRSAHAARLLDQAGFPDVLNMTGGMSCWTGPRDHAPGDPFGPAGPASWLAENAAHFPGGGEAIDVACGRGRHALLLAAIGFTVRALDRDEEKIAALTADAGRLGLPVRAEAIDLERPGADLGSQVADLILVVRYLHRPLFPALLRALRPGGLLIYEAFTTAQAGRGHPRNPEFLLEPGELKRLVAGLEILAEREGEHDGAMVSGIAARRPHRPAGA